MIKSLCSFSKHMLLLLLLSRFSRVRLLATPWTAAHQAPPSMGFSRQEYWSGLPLPSPFQSTWAVYNSRKTNWMKSTLAMLTCVIVLSHSVMSDFLTPWTVARQAPPSMGFSRQEYWSGLPYPPLGDLPNPGIEHRSPTLQVDSLPSKPPGKPTLTYQSHNDAKRTSKGKKCIDSQMLTRTWRIYVLFNIINKLQNPLWKKNIYIC